MPVSDYTIDNLLIHLKALDALGLWKCPTWDEVARMLGWQEPYSAMIGNIEYLLIEKISEELRIDPDDEAWLERAAAVLRLKKKNANFDDIIEAFYWRQHSRRLRAQLTLEGESIEVPEDISFKLHRVHPYPHEDVERWLSERNEVFGGERPFDLLKSGEFDRVRQELERILDEREAREQERFEKEWAERERVAARRKWNPLWRLLEAYEQRRLRKMVKAIDQVVPQRIETFRR